MINEIINLLDNEINLQKQELTTKTKNLFGNLIDLKELVQKIKDDYNQLEYLNLNQLTTNLEIDLETITKLEMYQFFAKTRNFALEPSQIEDIINSGKRENAGKTLPPNGLYLVKVMYE